MTTVDWKGELQVADARGNTWPVTVLATELDRKLVHVPSWGESMWVNDDGSVRDHTWVIRNTPAAEQFAENAKNSLPPALQQRMVALVRGMAAGDRFPALSCMDDYASARAIVADPGFPAEVDADEREIARLTAGYMDDPDMPANDAIRAAYLRGKQMAGEA